MSRHGLSRHGLISAAPGTPVAAGGKKKRRCGEVMGGATAECTAVVCCCPFAVMDALVLALYKAPRGMCRKAIEKKRRRTRNRRLLKLRESGEGPGGKKDESVVVVVGGKPATEEATDGEAAAMEAVDLEMYDKFYGTGFWRSCSQRSSDAL
uniref:Uncharacterized protein n=1 Tax=Kalanchoe fedtschenkoi TaxID=63787 RepID=A0A7N0USZ5_KALFE